MKSLLSGVLLLAISSVAGAGTKTWDGKYETDKIEVTIAYFVPGDRKPLPDWRDRVDYFCRRIEQFHEREFQGQSALTTKVHSEPLVSSATTGELRQGDANAIFFRTLKEADERLEFARGNRTAFPILLVLSEINWRPLDDFYRVAPQDGNLVFEGNYTDDKHFPGAAAGGARATYLADRGVGWGLVSADGWRVPYRGSDCVVYHEGCGHTVGLPHPDAGNGSVMSMGQYLGWISESWLDKEQKSRLGWEPQEVAVNKQLELFSRFRALPQPPVPHPGQGVTLSLDWPDGVQVDALRVRFQTAVDAPWIEAPQSWEGDTPSNAVLGAFDRATPVSYRVDARLKNGATAELWGYLQVREDPRQGPLPFTLSPDLIPPVTQLDASDEIAAASAKEVDLLELADPATCWSVGDWSKSGGILASPKQYGTRLELPYSPPAEYRLTLIVEPLDEPNGLIFGQRSGANRFATLLNYTPAEDGLSALENVDGQNVGNETTFTGSLFRKDRLSQAIIIVKKDEVTMSVDGRSVVRWRGSPDRLSLSEYWKTPNEMALFVGSYDCRYRFHRITLEPISGEGRILARESQE